MISKFLFKSVILPSIFFILAIRSVYSQIPDTLIQNLISQVNLDTVSNYVNILSGEDSVTISGSRYLITSRSYNHPHNELAANYLFETLQDLGLSTYNQIYSANGRNVYAIQTGTDYPEQQFIICAHYDDVPFSSLAPGADDNASGCAAVLETARILSQYPTPYTVIYALWDEEEIGLVGSANYAQQAFQSGANIRGVINLEMFGWDGNDDGLIDIHTQSIGNSVELANLVNYLENQYQIGLSPVIYNPGTSASDHSSFWNYGYGAIVFSEAFYGGDMNPSYHTANDRISHFNLGYFFALSQLAVATISQLAFHNTLLEIDKSPNLLADNFILEQNYPNPFNPVTVISWQLTVSSHVTLMVFNALGREVQTLVDEGLSAGNHKVVFDARGLPSGLYFYRLEAGGMMRVRQMLLLR
jgi:hypothetical protein